MNITLERPEVDNEKPGEMTPPPAVKFTIEERVAQIDAQRAALVQEAKTRLADIAALRANFDAEEAKLTAFVAANTPPEPEPPKPPKAARGSVRGPVEAWFREHPGSVYSTAQVAGATSLDAEQVGGAAAKLAKDGILHWVSRGHYKFGPAATVPE